MITRISSIEELKQMYAEILMNKTLKVTKVSNESIVNGVAYGVAKIGQKALKDIALVETHLFPDYAFGQHLDEIAQKSGVSTRYSASQSSTYLRLVGLPGTTYTAGSHVFSGGGSVFDLMDTVTLDPLGFAYVLIRSQTSGSRTNVDPLTISSINPAPSGHLFCVNEYRASGGRDAEDDKSFRLRIKEGANLAATATTLSKITQVFQKINPIVFKVYYQGVNSLIQPVLAVATVNGSNLTQIELDYLKSRAAEYLSLYELPLIEASPSIEVKNIDYQPVDITFRVQLETAAVVDEVRKRIQIALGKYLDWRYWKQTQLIEWDNLLQIVKDDPQVIYVPDQYFIPNADQTVDPNKLPRMRGFIIQDMDGNILANFSGTLNPVFYPTEPNLFFQTTILSSI